ncbi:hypothetical protein GALMADRAFT_157514 [Galerina marginata CBS 339.88]|uniref:DRBM domain-containing protein n=1 Tax=Galerina marginata (strain CBS 339.88) TaxID=685588 RepID=A0A067T2S9_GALM3|nr:hypothetical protein GALMADRAFT_157514 [Galerina marginata CBS 339.88]
MIHPNILPSSVFYYFSPAVLMQRFLDYISSKLLLTRVFEPSIGSWKIQLAVKDLCPRLCSSKFILLCIARALTPHCYHEEMTQSMAEEAAMITSQVSKLVETAEQSSQLLDNIVHLDRILCEIQIFVQSETQWPFNFLFSLDLSARRSVLKSRLTTVLRTFEAVSRNSQPEDGFMHGIIPERSPNIGSFILPDTIQASQQPNAGPNLRHQAHFRFSQPFSLLAGILTFHSTLSGAHHFVCTGATFNNILGNYVVMTEPSDTSSSNDALKGIVNGLRALNIEDVSLERQICKGRGYRLYSAQNKKSGEVVAVKVYEGSHAKERCLKAAKFMIDHKVIHSNIPHMIAVSLFKSETPFLVFDGEYEDSVDHMLGQVLKKDLKQSLVLGLQTVIGLSSGLDYLQDLKYPFASVGLDHFSLFSCKGKIIISFDPEELDQMTEPDPQIGPSNGAHEALQIFHGLCQKTFDAACKNHYESQEVQRSSVDELDDGLPDKESDDLDVPDLATAPHSVPSSMSTQPSSGRPPRRTLPNGHRRELVWKPPMAETDTLDDISRQFQYFLRSNSDHALIRRRGRYTARTAHRCPGYNRVEITLTTDISRSAIIRHSSPTPHEICLVCKEVVKAMEVFNCVCGGEDDESVPTARCTVCSEWHHWPCVEGFISRRHRFVCEPCQATYNSLNTSHVTSNPITKLHNYFATRRSQPCLGWHEACTGPQNSLVWKVICNIDGRACGEGRASSKSVAKNLAAEAALKQIEAEMVSTSNQVLSETPREDRPNLPPATAIREQKPSSALTESIPGPDQDTTSLFEAARSKLQQRYSARDNMNFHRWVLLKNSIIRSSSQSTSSNVTSNTHSGANSYEHNNDSQGVDDGDLDDPIQDPFIFPDPDVDLLVSDRADASGAQESEAQWLDSLLDALDDDGGVNVNSDNLSSLFPVDDHEFPT